MTLQKKKYLFDILSAAELILDFISEVDSFAAYTDDNKTKSAVERQLGIIGEAANKLDKIYPEDSLKHVEQIIGLRNRIIHAYNNINDAMIWTIVKKHIPELLFEVKQKLDS
ncbi:MAG: DUF86 domain-containing protein [Prolixibacteraceae bacterium]